MLGALRWVGYILAALLVISAVLGGGVFILLAVAILGICFGAMCLVGFVAACLKTVAEADRPKGTPTIPRPTQGRKTRDGSP